MLGRDYLACHQIFWLILRHLIHFLWLQTSRPLALWYFKLSISCVPRCLWKTNAETYARVRMSLYQILFANHYSTHEWMCYSIYLGVYNVVILRWRAKYNFTCVAIHCLKDLIITTNNSFFYYIESNSALILQIHSNTLPFQWE